jgi:hypothetical protein
MHAPLHAAHATSLPAAIPVRVPAARINPAYLNYDFRASPRDVHGSFDYGLPLGSGIAQVSTLARLFGEHRGVMLTGFSWQRYSDSGNTLVIGDSESRRGLYEDTVRFDGIQYSSPDFSYDAGWQRTDFGDAPMRTGGFVAQATAAKPLSAHLRAEAHIFAGSGTLLIGAGGVWSNTRFGDLQFGVAPARRQGITGYFGYALHARKLKFTLDDRIWTAQAAVDSAQLVQPNYRQLRAAVEYAAAPDTTLRLIYGLQTQGFLSARTLTAGYARRVGDADAHLDFAAVSSGGRRSAGFTTYLSVPLGEGRSFLEQSSLSGGVPESAVTLKQDLPNSGTGAAYALKLENAGTSLTDATFHAQTNGSSTQVELLRAAGRMDWNSEFSGSLVFFGGKELGVNQTIDASGAFQTLKGRTAVRMRVVAESGKALPPGAIVRALYEPGEWRLSSNGDVELDQITPGPQTFIVTTPSASCSIATIVPPAVSGEPDMGTQVCR